VATDAGTRSFDALDSLFAEVDAISIVTPTSTHGEVARQAFDRGIHCFVEKPIAATYTEASQLVQRAEQSGCVLQVGHVERFNPAFLAVEQIGLSPMFIETHRLAQFQPRATDVAVVLDLMIHDIDLALCIVDSPVAEIRASGVAVISDLIDIANARLEFENGCVANLTASRISQRPMRKMRLFQRDAYISLDFSKPEVEVFRIADSGEPGVEGTTLLGEIEAGTQRRSISYEQPSMPKLNPIGRELELFARAVQAGERPSVTGAEATEALRIAEEIIRTIEEGR
jgi:predicted dehydrogenase